jgi:hypothetical protein
MGHTLPARPLLDGWYQQHLEGVDAFEVRLAAPLRRAAARFGPLRATLLFAASVRRPAVAVVRVDRGWRSLLLLRALLGRERKLVVLQFIELAPPAEGPRRALELLWRRLERWALRRALRTAHVLTQWERGAYAERFGIPESRFVHVPWPWRETPAPPVAPPYHEDGPVVCGGRAFCDWETLAAAVSGLDLPLVVVCQRSDLGRLGELARTATVRCEVPAAEYRALLAQASLSIAPMVEGNTSQGHVRVTQANEAGVPLIVSGTRSLAGYVLPGRTAVTVPPGDAGALRDAIEALMDSPERRRELREAALGRSARWSGADFGRAIEALIFGGSPVLPDESF